ncbi:unnamed protein product [Ilex paraguariensis]|uniref:5-formyltetrahydrofolate cyclo-ligase n=1 Tax=Ilex paraguariensis TaxID=185542 RepID=A0ABC8R1J2_9AQUA
MTLSTKRASATASPFLTSLCSAIVRTPHRNVVTMNDGDNPNQLEEIFQKKEGSPIQNFQRACEHEPITKISRRLDFGTKEEFDLRYWTEVDNAIQRIILETPWLKTSKNLCSYISSAALRKVDTSKILSEVLGDPGGEGHARSRKNVYVPRVEDRFSNMRMLKISSVDDLVASSMNILKPAPVACDLNEREDVMQACEPVDLFILPGLAFDKSGKRLGRGGVYILCSNTYNFFFWSWHYNNIYDAC